VYNESNQQSAISNQQSAISNQQSAISNQRNASIDILRFFAILLITNSHMVIMYAKFPILATGGVIGNSLFFFCSGFTLFLGEMERFDNWYKRRINRIYPSMFIWAFIQTLFGLQSLNLVEIICSFGYWFIQCIMLHYIVLYIIRKFCLKQSKFIFFLFCIATLLVYFFKNRPNNYMWNEDGDLVFRFFLFFIITLFGSILGLRQTELKYKNSDVIMFFIFMIIYHSIMLMARYNNIANRLQIICVAPLTFIIYYSYKICNLDFMKKIYAKKIVGTIMHGLSMLTLEIYLVQGLFIGLINDKLNIIFPFNLIIAFTIISIAGYILKMLTKYFSITFNKINTNFKDMLKL
jgi:peptidoglycan/LPS O-acetylase OafA/YrhL